MIYSNHVRKLVPYLQLMRFDKPAGFLYLYLPSMAGTSVAASLSKPKVSFPDFLITNLILLLSSVLMRGAGCSWNDILDRKLDQQVMRTRSRPLARGAITPLGALVCTILQLLLFLKTQVHLPYATVTAEVVPCVLISLPFLAATGIYPIMKRITNYPQVFLTIPSSWGIFVAFSALGIDVFSSATDTQALVCLLAWNMAWTVSYDLIYAFQDIKDDRKAGIKSIAVKHEDHGRFILVGLGIVQIMSLLSVCMLISAGLLCFLGAAVCVIALVWMVSKVDLQDPADCAWWFKFGGLFVGVSSSAACFIEYVTQRV